jgi:hypothetical protein
MWVAFVVLTVVAVKNIIFLVVTLCSLEKPLTWEECITSILRFKEKPSIKAVQIQCCHLLLLISCCDPKDLYGITTKNTIIFKVRVDQLPCIFCWVIRVWKFTIARSIKQHNILCYHFKDLLSIAYISFFWQNLSTTPSVFAGTHWLQLCKTLTSYFHVLPSMWHVSHISWAKCCCQCSDYFGMTLPFTAYWISPFVFLKFLLAWLVALSCFYINEP